MDSQPGGSRDMISSKKTWESSNLLEVTGLNAGVVFKCLNPQVSRLGITNGFAYHSEIHAATISISSPEFQPSVEILVLLRKTEECIFENNSSLMILRIGFRQ